MAFRTLRRRAYPSRRTWRRRSRSAFRRLARSSCISSPPARQGGKASFRDIIDIGALRSLLDYPFIVFIMSSLLIFIPMAAYYSYAPVFVNDLGLSHPGFRMSFGQMSEIIFMLIIPLLFSRLGVKWMIGCSMLAWSLRYGLFAWAAVDAVSITRVPSPCSDVSSSRQMASLSSTMRIEEVLALASLEGSKGGVPRLSGLRSGQATNVDHESTIAPGHVARAGISRGVRSGGRRVHPRSAAAPTGPRSGGRGARFGSKLASSIIRAVGALARAER